MTRAVPQSCIDFIAAHEGCVLTAYQDASPKRVWTNGFGNTIGVVPGSTITLAQAYADLATNAARAADALAKVIDDAVIQALTENQWSATVDFAFNLGTGSPPFPIWALYNAKEYDQIPSRMQLYVKAGGLKLQGLVQRRADEAVLWGTGEPGSSPVTLSSSVTRAVATPAVPLDAKPKGIKLLATAAGAVVAGAIPQAQSAVQAVSDAITPSAGAAPIIGHVLSLLGVVGAGLAVAALGFKYLHDRQVSQPPQSTAPALHPISLTSESNVNPVPPSPSGSTLPPVTQSAVGVVQPNSISGGTVTGTGVGFQVGGKPTLDVLTALRDRLGRIWTTVTGDIRSFTGKTISEIVAEVDKIGADLESKL